MPNIRLMLWGVLAAILFLNYETWMHDYQPATPAATSAASAAMHPGVGASSLGDSVPQPAHERCRRRGPRCRAAPPRQRCLATRRAPAATAPAASASTSPVRVTTDVLDIVINLKGGELDRADLLAYPLRKDTPNIPVRLLNDDPADAVPAAKRTDRRRRRSGTDASGHLSIRAEGVRACPGCGGAARTPDLE